MPSQTEIYRRLLTSPANGYGFGDHWKPAWHRIFALPGPATLLDVGCGRGGLVLAAKRCGIAARGCDLAPCEPWIEQATLPVLPYGNGAFEVVGCFDVLEHLSEHQVGAAIDELRRVCSGRVILSVASCSDQRDVPGMGVVELHLTQQPLAWWLAQCGDAEVITVTGQPDWRHYIEVRP